jgi:tRNA(fMet)-specific endonuclease VapC
VFLFRQKYGVAEKLAKLNPEQCYVSEVTIAELTYGAYKSDRVEENLQLIEELVSVINVIPFAESIEIYAKEKVRLRALGTPIDDFDLLIAAAAVQQELILVTDNVRHFKNIQGLVIENWVER